MRHKIKSIIVHIYPDSITRIFYQLEGTPPDIIGFTEKECFFTKGECAQNKPYECGKATVVRISSIFARLCLGFAMTLLFVPFMIIQVVCWLFTGRKERITYRIMDKIADKLDNE